MSLGVRPCRGRTDMIDTTQLRDDGRAVSPVIGVILMVAITVILAAVIGTFVLGLGDEIQGSQTPQASFTFDYDAGGTPNDGTLDITHDGGDKLQNSQVSVKFAGTDDGSGASVSSDFPTEIAAGDTATVSNVDSQQTVRVVWEASGGDETATLGKWTGPDA